MCHFISGVIDRQVRVDVLNQLGSDYAITFETCDNDFVKSQLQGHEQYIIKKTKSCDCGTELGLTSRLAIPDAGRIEKKELDRLEKKGWSAGKIERWKAEKSKTMEKDKIRYDRMVTAHHPDIKNWIKYLNTVLAGSSVFSIGLILHWYKGGTLTERIKMKDQIKIRIEDLDQDFLLRMEEDCIYCIMK